MWPGHKVTWESSASGYTQLQCRRCQQPPMKTLGDKEVAPYGAGERAELILLLSIWSFADTVREVDHLSR